MIARTDPRGAWSVVALTLAAALLVLTTAPATAQTAVPSTGASMSYGVSSGMLVDEGEALEVARVWYEEELERIGDRLRQDDLAERRAGLVHPTVLYLVPGIALSQKPPVDGPILAYAVMYEPTGYVVVSGLDRIEPITVFSTESDFRWDQPDLNFLRYYLATDLPRRWEHVEDSLARGIEMPVHPNWERLRSRLRSGGGPATISGIEAVTQVLVEWETALWGQYWPYNDTVVTNNGNTAGIPTGCTATAMAIKMRFHEWPPGGASSHSYNDTQGSIQFSHSVNYGNETYDWAAMPVAPLTAANAAVADLMYHAGVAVDMDYEVGRSGAWPTASSFNAYFRYKGTIELTSGHETPIRDSVRGGLPVVLSSEAHTVIADGYRDTGLTHFHLNIGWEGSSNGWYNLDQIPGGDATIDTSYPYSSPGNYYYVDPNWTGTENGNLQNPFNSFDEGYNSAKDDQGHLWLKNGTYTGVSTLDDEMMIHSYEGTATLQLTSP